ncbi:uncharacterized protein LOC123675789 [Harmonia axyridis]|uniref:uncharacterized protein LOC123675789 n=1 Tax=Harmonia axyridis TaxID=115357 RepID=UPI001E275CB5|nr:uncharacterized protein LOC123675789 [Harmonia axyridis]
MSLLLISTLFLIFSLSSICNSDEKNWLDRCDINRMKEMPPEIPSATSIPYTTTTKKKGLPWLSKKKGFRFRPMANEKDILGILREKLLEDSNSRVREEENSAELEARYWRWFTSYESYKDYIETLGV